MLYTYFQHFNPNIMTKVVWCALREHLTEPIFTFWKAMLGCYDTQQHLIPKSMLPPRHYDTTPLSLMIVHCYRCRRNRCDGTHDRENKTRSNRYFMKIYSIATNGLRYRYFTTNSWGNVTWTWFKRSIDGQKCKAVRPKCFDFNQPSLRLHRLPILYATGDVHPIRSFSTLR